MTTVEILRAARELIEDPEHWTKGTAARDFSGQGCYADHPDARQWCAMGAVYRVGGASVASMDALETLERCAVKLWPDVRRDTSLAPAARLNDERGHAAVLEMFDRAIALAEEARSAGKPTA